MKVIKIFNKNINKQDIINRKNFTNFFLITFFFFSLFSNINTSNSPFTSLSNSRSQSKSSFSSFIEVDSSKADADNGMNNNNQIFGKMQINGEEYNASCDCNPISPINNDDPINNQKKNGPKCDPTKLRIHEERKGQGASFEDVRALIGNIEDLTYVVVPETSFKCLDGRNAKALLGTPGGDAGEFILGLMVYEDLLGGGKKLTQDNVDLYLSLYLKSMKQPKFYMCSDDAAIDHVQKELAVNTLKKFF